MDRSARSKVAVITFLLLGALAPPGQAEPVRKGIVVLGQFA